MFIDREQELDTLRSEYEKDGSSLVIVYGRRRTGKTALITEFAQQKKALYFLATEESELQNRNLFKEKAAAFINSALLRDAQVSSWDIIFTAIMEHRFDTKPIIVIDEFQNIGKSNFAFPSVFQRIWDELLKDKEVMVILCGSLISMMESQTLSYSSPLYGRRTAQIKLVQIPFRYYIQFFPDADRRKQIERFSVTGGIPKYVEMFSGQEDIYQAIEHSVLNRSSFLYDEPRFLLQQEVSEVGSYFSVIRTIAAGNRKLSAISANLEVKATSLTKYLSTLIDLDILEREVPVTEDNPEKSKRGLYRIKDNYIRFWFRFIYPNLSYIESGNSALVMDWIRKDLIKQHTAFVYEDICRERLWDMNRDEIWPFKITKIGRYWDKDTEIDIAAVDLIENNLLVGECKYWQEPVGLNVLTELERKTDKISWRKDCRKEWFVLFSMCGFTEELIESAKSRPDVLLVSE